MQHLRGVTGLTPGVTVWQKSQIWNLPPAERETITTLIDTAGVRSGKAQGLPGAITSVVRVGCFLFMHLGASPPAPLLETPPPHD